MSFFNWKPIKPSQPDLALLIANETYDTIGKMISTLGNKNHPGGYLKERRKGTIAIAGDYWVLVNEFAKRTKTESLLRQKIQESDSRQEHGEPGPFSWAKLCHEIQVSDEVERSQMDRPHAS
jgi:hypothetical protein